MNIECIKEKLSSALSKAEKITGKNITLPILSCILLEAVDSRLIIRSTNLDIGIEIELPVKVITPGTIAVSGSILNTFISNIPNDKNITLEEVSGNLKVSTKQSESIIKSFPVDDFPKISKINNQESLVFNNQDFVKGLKSVVYSASTSTIRPALSSVLVYPEDNSIVFAATDSFRLSEKRIKIKKTVDFKQVLIPSKNVSEIIRVCDGLQNDIEIFINENQIAFQYENIYITSRVVDGVFPEYKQLIPTETKTEVTVLKQDIITAFKVSNIFLDKFSRVTFEIDQKNKKFNIITKNIDVGENTQAIDAVIKGEGLTINFSYKYIIDCFQSIEGDSVSLSFVDVNRPMVLHSVSDKTFTYLVMPMNK